MVTAVILAAGRGTRMKQHTDNLTKAMLPITDINDGVSKPTLHVIVDRCKAHDINDFIFVVGYRKQDIIDYFQTEYKNSINAVFVEQTNITGGTADAVRCVEPYIRFNESFILIYGDVVPSLETVEMLKKYCHIKQPVMAVRTVPDPERYGVVKCNGDNVVEILEKCQNPPTNLINAGLYVLNYLIFKYITLTPLSARGEYELTTSLQLFINDGATLKYCPIDNVLDIGTKEIYEEITQQHNKPNKQNK